MIADDFLVGRSAPAQLQHLELTDWQVALLKSIWRRPSLWVDGHRDVDELRRRGLITMYERYLFLTEAGLSIVRAVS